MYKSLSPTRLSVVLFLTVLCPSLLLARAPVATNDTYATGFRTTLTIPAPGILANDADSNGNPFTITPLVSQTYTFNGITFDQALTPNFYQPLGVGTFSNAVVTALPSTVASGVAGFPDSGTSFYFGDSIGRLAEDSGSTTTTKALNLPAGNDGSVNRSGFESSWASGVMLTNTVGDDFVIFEAGSTNVAEAFMVQVHDAANDVWSPWVYITPQSYKFYAGSGSEGLHSTKFDLDSFGIPANGYIDRLRVVNMTTKDRMLNASGEGIVLPEDNGATVGAVKPKKPVNDTTGSGAEYPATSFDPDIVYIGSLHTLGATVPAYAAVSELGATVTVNSDGSFTYDPSTSGVIQDLPFGGSATDTFYYLIADTFQGHARGIVTINITTPNPPTLAITRSGNSVTLRWPNTFTDFALQSTPALEDPITWTDVDIIPSEDGSDFTVTVDASTGNSFFRLAQVLR